MHILNRIDAVFGAVPSPLVRASTFDHDFGDKAEQIISNLKSQNQLHEHIPEVDLSDKR